MNAPLHIQGEEGGRQYQIFNSTGDSDSRRVFYVQLFQHFAVVCEHLIYKYKRVIDDYYIYLFNYYLMLIVIKIPCIYL